MISYSRKDLLKKPRNLSDEFINSLKQQWFNNSHKIVAYEQFKPLANEWFRSSKLNHIAGWDDFPCVDVIMGCTHFIESLIIKYSFDGLQILKDEYGYFGLQGKHGVELDELVPDKPLYISLPNWKYCDIRPEWPELLRIAEQKNIDIHIDFAWITTAKDCNIDLSHPNIKSFCMSLSKYSLQWNRIGLRWSKQRTMDSITMYNRFYGDVNSSLTSCGAFMIENIPRDYGWNTYGNKYYEVCKNLEVTPTKMIHVVKDPVTETPMGVSEILVKS